MEHSKITLTPIAESMNNHVDILKKASDSLIKVSKLSGERCIQVDIDADLETIGTAYYLLKTYYSNALRANKIPEADEMIRKHVTEYMEGGRQGIKLIRKG